MYSNIVHEHEPAANAVRARLNAVVGRGQSTYTPTQVVVDRAEGARIWTLDGRELIDLAAGVLVANLGHHHPLFERKVLEYAGGLPRTAYNMVAPLQVEASERLVRSMGANANAHKVLWAASGSEGIQKAMWCAQHRYPDRPVILATRHGFHGKKGLAGEVTGDKSANPNVHFISFPMDDERPQAYYEAELDAIAAKYPHRICLLITEPYLGAAGSYHPPKWYHPLLERWCKQHDIVFIFDEVQSCHGRTGNMYAFETYGVQPDLVVLGKGLANGEPAAAVVGRADLIDALEYGEASDTFSATPRACAAVCATLDVFEQERIVEHVRRVAGIMKNHLDALMAGLPFIKAVRGEGLVYGVEMDSKDRAEACVLEAYRGNGETGVHFLGPLAGKVLRVSPPLTITGDDLDIAFSLLGSSWGRVAVPAATVT